MDRVKMAPFGFIIFFGFFLSHTPGSSRRSSYLGKSYWTDEFQKCTPIYNLGWRKNLIPWGIHFVTATCLVQLPVYYLELSLSFTTYLVQLPVYYLLCATFTFVHYLPYAFTTCVLPVYYLELSLSFTTCLLHFCCIFGLIFLKNYLTKIFALHFQLQK